MPRWNVEEIVSIMESGRILTRGGERALSRTSTGLVYGGDAVQHRQLRLQRPFSFSDSPEGAFVHITIHPSFKIELTIA